MYACLLPTVLEKKLLSVEKEFSEKLRLFQEDKSHGIQEKLVTVQKKYEIEKKKELQDEVCYANVNVSFFLNCGTVN